VVGRAEGALQESRSRIVIAATVAEKSGKKVEVSMSKVFQEGEFYEFDRTKSALSERGKRIHRSIARERILRGGDVYTPLASDAKALAKDVQKGKAYWEGAHDLSFFPHFHSAGNHDDYGHVFYGERGYRANEHRRT